MKFFLIAVFGAMTVLTTAASAQDASKWTSALATFGEGFGQGVGEAVNGGASVFVTATGRARIPNQAADVEIITVEGKATSATEATRIRDGRLATAQTLARRFGVTLDVGESNFSRQQNNTLSFQNRDAERAAIAANAAASMSSPTAPPPLKIAPPGRPATSGAEQEFITRTNVRLRSPDPERMASFLDALIGAGVDIDFVANGGVGFPNSLFRNNEVLGFGALEKIDDSIWDQASANAIAEARRQATVFATAAGRQVGEAKQILLLGRGSQGDEASVTVAVRFAFAPTK